MAFLFLPVPIRFSFSFALLLTLTCPGWAAPEPPELQAAAQAMRDKLPEVAIGKLERFLAGEKVNPELAAVAKLRLVESCVRAGKFIKALEVTVGVAFPPYAS